MINEKRRENEEILAKHKKEICELKKSLEALDRDLAKANLDKEMGAKAESSTLATSNIMEMSKEKEDMTKGKEDMNKKKDKKELATPGWRVTEPPEDSGLLQQGRVMRSAGLEDTSDYHYRVMHGIMERRA